MMSVFQGVTVQGVNAAAEQVHFYRHSRSRAEGTSWPVCGSNLRNIEDCFNSDLFQGKIHKIQLFFLKTRSVLEAYQASGANKEVKKKNVLLYVR